LLACLLAGWLAGWLVPEAFYQQDIDGNSDWLDKNNPQTRPRLKRKMFDSCHTVIGGLKVGFSTLFTRSFPLLAGVVASQWKKKKKKKKKTRRKRKKTSVVQHETHETYKNSIIRFYLHSYEFWSLNGPSSS